MGRNRGIIKCVDESDAKSSTGATTAADLVRCDACGAVLPRHARYVVRIEVYADPAVPPLTGADIAAAASTLEAVLEELKGYSADELQDQVHRAFEYSLCPSCQRSFIANPLGHPRVRRTVGN